MTKILRVPRKRKKCIKKIWEKRRGVKLIIIKKSIEYCAHEYSDGKPVWQCMTRQKK